MLLPSNRFAIVDGATGGRARTAQNVCICCNQFESPQSGLPDLFNNTGKMKNDPILIRATQHVLSTGRINSAFD